MIGSHMAVHDQGVVQFSTKRAGLLRAVQMFLFHVLSHQAGLDVDIANITLHHFSTVFDVTHVNAFEFGGISTLVTDMLFTLMDLGNVSG